MRPFWKCCSVLGLIAFGYLLGVSQMFAPRPVEAQADSAAPSEESLKKLKEAFTALKIAAESLEQESKYVPATMMLNVFAVTAGGLNCVTDLEEGRGVDPETFAALHAGEAKPEVQEHLDYDEQGRLTYKGKVVRIYPKQRMKKIYHDRQRYSLGGKK